MTITLLIFALKKKRISSGCWVEINWDVICAWRPFYYFFILLLHYDVNKIKSPTHTHTLVDVCVWTCRSINTGESELNNTKRRNRKRFFKRPRACLESERIRKAGIINDLIGSRNRVGDLNQKDKKCNVVLLATSWWVVER